MAQVHRDGALQPEFARGAVEARAGQRHRTLATARLSLLRAGSRRGGRTTTSTRVRSTSSRNALRKLWLMDRPFEPNDDDTPGVASTEKPAYGVRVAKLYTPDSPTVTPALGESAPPRGPPAATMRLAPLMSKRFVYDSSCSLECTRMSPPRKASLASTCARRRGGRWRGGMCASAATRLQIRYVRRHGEAAPVGARRQHVHIGAHQNLHRHQRRALRRGAHISRSYMPGASRGRALRSLSHTSGRVRSVTRCA